MVSSTFLAERLYAILESRGKTAAPFIDFLCVNEGDGPYLASWNEDTLGPTPTQEDVDAVDIETVLAANGIKSEIVEIEQANPVTHRASREMTLNTFLGLNILIDYINELEARIATLQGVAAAPKDQFPASYGVIKTKQIDDEITELRAQI